jgi:hypothetical protein
VFFIQRAHADSLVQAIEAAVAGLGMLAFTHAYAKRLILPFGYNRRLFNETA